MEEMLMSEKTFLNPPGLKPLGLYSNIAGARGGTLYFIAGQVAVDAQGKLVGKGDIQAQAERVFENLRLALQAVGATFEDVLKFTIFIKNLTPEARKAVMSVRNRLISQTHPPAATMIGIDQLVEEDLLVEIEAVAVVG
jgi:enamine deaminase RidA (YjgF/YER057c/UK114 family)